MTPEQTAALTRALRELNAAENSWRRASAEFESLLPEGVVLLHRPPGVSDGPETLYWMRDNRRGQFSTSSGRAADFQEEGMRAVIVEAPHPRKEFLPRLAAEQPRSVLASH
jgi:hypothetical protein